MNDLNHFDRNDPPWMKMLRPRLPRRGFKPEFRRYFRFPPKSKRPEARLNSAQQALDRKLTLDPVTGERVRLASAAEVRENFARHAREYAASTRELLEDPPDVACAWLERVRFETTWMDTPEYRKARGRSVLFSFVGIFVSMTGLYPAKIDALGLSFSPSTHAGFIAGLVGLIWYAWASVMVLTRDYLIEATCMDLEHKIKGRYKEYQNRWAFYIEWQHAEKAFFYKRLPSFIALLSVGCLFISLLRSVIVGG